MSIEKLNLISIVGPLEKYDEAIDLLIKDRNIHLEYAVNVLEGNKNLRQFDETNPYAEQYAKIKELVEKNNLTKCDNSLKFSIDDVNLLLEKINSEIQQISSRNEELKDERVKNEDIIAQLQPLCGIDANLDEIFDFKLIKYRFGKMPKSSYEKMETYVDDNEAFFAKSSEDKDYVYGVYFVPKNYAEKAERDFSAFFFEEILVSDKVKGKPLDAINDLKKENEEIEKTIKSGEEQLEKVFGKYEGQLVFYNNALSDIALKYEYKKYGTYTEKSFYLTGWVDKKTLKSLEKAVEKNDDFVISTENPDDVYKIIKPPTKLKNNPIFRPFEFFVKMYGLPSYNEIDPTPLVALSYILMFGIMFGDVGQGLVLAVLGFALYAYKKIDLAAIIGMVGISSAFFGWCFGSVFGYEDVIAHPLIFHPMSNINTILISTVVLGVFVITIAMIFNIANAMKNKNWGKAFFNQNGFAGLIFYWAIIIGVAFLFLKGLNLFTVVYNVIFIVIPLVLVFLQEPLTRLIKKKKDIIPGSKGQFFLESFFELFEILLSFVTNTISFVRIGAFALNHVGMMGVVFVFSKMASGGASIAVVIIGNIIVMAMEGLIVGIQVLRLEFYEIFSRFFEGNGKEFKPINK